MRALGRFPRIIAGGIAALSLAGCANSGGLGWGSRDPEPAAYEPTGPEIPATVQAAEVVGRWGYAAFHEAKDRPRTEANARGQCNHPFLINQGPTGGVMMYPPDQKELVELRLKGSTAGKNYIGPSGEAGGGIHDQEILSFDGRVMLLRAVDPEVAGRYGTGIYVRCGPTAGGLAQGKK